MLPPSSDTSSEGNGMSLTIWLFEFLLSMRNRLDSINLDCEKELAQRDQLYQKRMKLEAGVRQFENNNEEYVKIKKTVEEKVQSILNQ